LSCNKTKLQGALNTVSQSWLKTPLSVLLLWVVATDISFAQVNIDKYRDYFLVGQFGEVCTMCEVVVLCEAGTEVPEYTAVPASGSFTLYHLQTRTFWSQISTIWEWFISNFRADSLAARGHARPVYVHKVVDGNWSLLQVIEARLLLEPGVLEFGDTQINRVERSWLSADAGKQLGYCQRLPLWESLEVIAAKSREGQQ